MKTLAETTSIAALKDAAMMLREHLSQEAHDAKLGSTERLCPCQSDLNKINSLLEALR